MNEQLKMRFAAKKEMKRAKEWLEKVPEYDPGILRYPTLRVLCAYDDEPQAYLPMQQALMLESLALNPSSANGTGAQAARDLVKGAELVASSLGIKEIYFVATDEAIKDIAIAKGFEVLQFPVLRLKL